MLTTIVLLQESGVGPIPSDMINILFLLAFLLIFYFFLIRPQQKRAKEEKLFREGLQKGDKVITIGGIYGKITKIEESAVEVQIDDSVKIKVDKTALRAESDPAAKK